jgi:hypothetical protein
MLLTLRTSFRARATLQLEILALRHQLQVVKRSRPQRMRLTRMDRLLWVWISQVWDGWRNVIVIVTPVTVLVWHRRGFRLFWTWKSRRPLGRPGVPPDVSSPFRWSAASTIGTTVWRRSRTRRHGHAVGLRTVGARLTVHEPSIPVRIARATPTRGVTWCLV